MRNPNRHNHGEKQAQEQHREDRDPKMKGNNISNRKMPAPGRLAGIFVRDST